MNVLSELMTPMDLNRHKSYWLSVVARQILLMELGKQVVDVAQKKETAS